MVNSLLVDARSTATPTHLAPKLAISDVSKAFKTQGQSLNVLENIHLTLPAQEFACLVGASGCGKSTLLNIVAGLIKPTTGEIRVDGRLVQGPGSDRGMVFQSYTLFPWLTVADNIAFGLKLQKLSKAEQRQRVDYLLNVVGLTQFAQTYPKQLSGGMKQRVAIARALATKPEVLLMDEPFGALDAQTKEQMQQFLLELWSQTQTTVLMITHDVEEAIFLSQQVYVMGTHPGTIEQAIPIQLPAVRDLEMKLSNEFLEIKRDVIHALRES